MVQFNDRLYYALYNVLRQLKFLGHKIKKAYLEYLPQTGHFKGKLDINNFTIPLVNNHSYCWSKFIRNRYDIITVILVPSELFLHIRRIRTVVNKFKATLTQSNLGDIFDIVFKQPYVVLPGQKQCSQEVLKLIFEKFHCSSIFVTL